ncbi:hypothetical protein F5Y17DRAFT_168022 [Xylariaceae sp. FL0594]|nr:hypothetical protein F5Y17DRAFT_168022 [Xylariaceae sp. FL0594]
MDKSEGRLALTLTPLHNTRDTRPGSNNQHKPARLAQSVERETLNLKVAGSTPASGSIPDASQSTGNSNPPFCPFLPCLSF